MPCYNFKSITVVPTAKDFIDIVLSKTQRKTPTVIHKQYAIGRIRQFYMRKIKTCQQFFHDKLQAIVTDFPNVETIHPFYADLINVLYSKDHYKLALGQLNTAKNIIDGIARDQVKVLKYGESLYQCKTLKRTAFGRMCTVIKRQADNLKFLEDTRQHMSRLPTIDPDTRTLILCGFPNVGKSSFINKITRADVDVQPFPFTTKSLFVGHTDYKNLRWQVIDTPGVLDRPLDEHNTIEMLSITALAHLQAAVIYIMDLSEQCGYTISQQLALFESLRPLFRNKPILIAANKTDIRSFDDLPESSQSLIREVVRMPQTEDMEQAVNEVHDRPLFLQMSTVSETGVMFVRAAACDDLLARRVQAKLRATSLAQTNVDGEGDIASLLYVARPKPKRGRMWTDGTSGHIEKQEAAMEAAGVYEESDWTKDPDANDPAFKEIRETAAKIREARALCILESRARKNVRPPQIPRTARSVSVHKIRKELGERGLEVDMQKEGERGRAAKRAKRPRNSTPNPYREASIARASVPRSLSAVRDSKMLAKVNRLNTFA
ncbi:hypothetical protein AHF37_02681 [Paragonimus kellicotti]|nr:hypothetical protein AHF37_02681 [Paragonimus kellicotti]